MEIPEHAFQPHVAFMLENMTAMDFEHDKLEHRLVFTKLTDDWELWSELDGFPNGRTVFQKHHHNFPNPQEALDHLGVPE